MKTYEHRPERLPNGTHVHVRSEHFVEECDGVIKSGQYDDGWLYRIEVTSGDRLEPHRNEKGERSVWDPELRRIEERKHQ